MEIAERADSHGFTVLTPSPPRQAKRGAPFSPRLVKAAVARHPLPQGGEGGDFTLDRPSICTVYVVSNVETPGADR